MIRRPEGKDSGSGLADLELQDLGQVTSPL